MSRRFISYGALMGSEQMGLLCPSAVLIGRSNLDGWKLRFRGRERSACLTIEEAEGEYAPIHIWEIPDEDLDRLCERCSDLYRRETMNIEFPNFITDRDETADAVVLIMKDEFKPNLPSRAYFEACMIPYYEYQFDISDLWLLLKAISEVL